MHDREVLPQVEIPEKWTREPPCFAITIGVRLRSHTKNISQSATWTFNCYISNNTARCLLAAIYEIPCSRLDDVIQWKHCPRYWPFVWGIHRSPVNSPHKGQRRGALMSSLICARINGWVNNREAGDLRRHHAHCDVTVMEWLKTKLQHPTIRTTQFHRNTREKAEYHSYDMGMYIFTSHYFLWGIITHPSLNKVLA